MEGDYSIEKPRIGKLAGPNYRPWSVQVRRLLVGLGLWTVVELGPFKATASGTSPETQVASGSTTGDDPKRTEVKDAKASTIIMGLCGNSVLQHVLLLETAKEQWDALKALCQPLGLQQLGAKTQAFIGYVPQNGHTTVAEIANDLTTLQVEIGLISSPEKPTDSLKISVFFRVLRALDARFEPLILQLEISKTTTDFSAIVAFLTEAERRMGAKDPLKETVFSAQTPPKRTPTGGPKVFQGNCYNCGKHGHRAAKCRLPKKVIGPSTGPLATPGGRRGLSPGPESTTETSWTAFTGHTEPTEPVPLL